MDVPTPEQKAAQDAYFREHRQLLDYLQIMYEAQISSELGRFEVREHERRNPCVGSGFCCKKSPCPFGQRDARTGWCMHLVPWEGDELGVPRYRCARYEYIKTQPHWQILPAFGGGCALPNGNLDRERVLVELRRKKAVATGG